MVSPNEAAMLKVYSKLHFIAMIVCLLGLSIAA